MTFETGTGLYARHVGRYADALADALVERAGLRPEDRALDVGCGAGAALAALAARVGGDHVAGVDPSAPFLALARARVPAADVRIGEAESLPFADGSFDVVVSQLVLNFMRDAPAGVREMRRVASRTVAACVWDYADGMRMLRAFWDAARALDPGAPDEHAMRWCSPAELRQLWTDAGLLAVEVDEAVVSASYADFEDFWAPFPSGIGPSGAYCASLSAEGQARLREGCFRELGRPSGPFELQARAWIVVGAV
jgi:SAM-dependent methyltransferase